MVSTAAPNAADVVQALKNDARFKFKGPKGRFLQKGSCPNCNKRELFVSIDKPWQISCNRTNNCNYKQKTRALYPHLWQSYSERHPATTKDPNATAEAYLIHERGFDPGVIEQLYTQGLIYIKGSSINAPTVRFFLDPEHTRWWERIIVSEHVRQAGKKANFGGKRQPDGSVFKNGCWMPHHQTIDPDDWVWICEGVFKCLALMHVQFEPLNGDSHSTPEPPKVCAALSSTNLPRDLIGKHAGDNITWVLAFDNDRAGRNSARKFRKELTDMGQRVRIALPRGAADWDDEWRNQVLDKEYLEQSLLYGAIRLATRTRTSAFWRWVRQPRTVLRFPHQSSLWRCTLNDRDKDKAESIETLRNTVAKHQIWLSNSDDYIEKIQKDFDSFSSYERIAPCHPELLYLEKDEYTGDQHYFFQVCHANGNPTELVGLKGGALNTPTTFDNALLNESNTGRFDGNAKDMRHFRDRWMGKRTNTVQVIPHIGYHREVGAYIFPTHGYQDGRLLKLNAQKFLTTDKHRIKTRLKSIDIVRPDTFDPAWITTYVEVFGLNGLILMSWWLGTLFAEQVRAMQQSWTFLEYTGEFNAGKSTQIEFMWRCCGRDNEEGFDPARATAAGRARRMVQVANLPVVLIESDRDEIKDSKRIHQSKFDFEELKTLYNGRPARTTGVKNSGVDTNDPAFRGGIVISQNASVSGTKALMSRIVHAHITKDKFTLQSTRLAHELSQMTSAQMGGWMDTALRLEPHLMDLYQERFEKIAGIFAKMGQAQNIDHRLIKCHSQVVAWSQCLPQLFKNHWNEGWTQALEQQIWQRCVIRQQKHMQANDPTVTTFWEIYELINNNSYDNKERLNHSSKDDRIAINLQHFFREARQYGADQPDTQRLKELLPHCQTHPYLGQQNIRSKILNKKVVHCWVFQSPAARQEQKKPRK